MVYHKMERYPDAINIYERILIIDKAQSLALNNLAWLLVTVPQTELRNAQRALILAQKAVDLERSPIYLDTLAEAYYMNGYVDKAIETIKEAISLKTGGGEYYKKQLNKFLAPGEVRLP